MLTGVHTRHYFINFKRIVLISKTLKILNLKDEPEHLATLADWHQREWSCLNPGEDITMRIERMQSFLNNEFIPSTYIAKQDELLGSAAIVSNDKDTRPQLSPWLASVFVAENHRAMGIGSKLILHVMAQAKREGIKTLYLFTPDNENFYKKLGWKNLADERYHGQQVSVMFIHLNND